MQSCYSDVQYEMFYTFPVMVVADQIYIHCDNFFDINKCLGGKVLLFQSITFLWPFGKNLEDKFNPPKASFLPKICHNELI